MIAEIDRGLSMIDERFSELATNGDERANHFLNSLTRARNELDALAAQAGTQDGAIGSLAERTAALRESIDRLATEVRDEVGSALGEAQGRADRLIDTTGAMKPEIGWVRDAAIEAGSRMDSIGENIAEQQDRFAALLAAVDGGVDGAEAQASGAVNGAGAGPSAKRRTSRRKPRRRWSLPWSRSKKPPPMPPNALARPSRR